MVLKGKGNSKSRTGADTTICVQCQYLFLIYGKEVKLDWFKKERVNQDQEWVMT